MSSGVRNEGPGGPERFPKVLGILWVLSRHVVVGHPANRRQHARNDEQD